MNIKAVFLLIAASFLPLFAAADDVTPRKGGVAYIPADSVSVEDVFFSRLLSEYMGDDSTMRARPVALTEESRAALVADSAAWNRDVAANLTLWGETSVPAIDNMYTAARMFLVDPSYRYADMVERTLYNGVLAGLDSTADAVSRRNAAQAVLDAVGMTYAASGSDVYINLFYRNKAYVRNDSVDMVILQNTSSPWKGDVFFAMKFESPAQYMRLHIRLPGWLRGEVSQGGRYIFDKTREFYQVMVNGSPLTVRAVDGYIVLDRVWKSDDVVRISMKTPVRRIRENSASGKGRFALQRGPIVYAYCGNETSRFFRASDAVGTSYDNEVLHTNMLVAKIYSSRIPGNETPWDCYLLPYYVLPSAKGSEKSVWLDEIE